VRAARYLIAVLCAAALLLIILILAGSDVDETSARAIGTAVALAVFSLTGMAGKSLASRRPDLSLLGYLTAAVSLAAFPAAANAIWDADLFGAGGTAAGDTLVLALAGGHASLLLGSQREEDGEAVRLVRAGVLAAIALLSLIAIVEISSDGEHVGAQAIAVLVVLYVLGTIVLPVLRRTSSHPKFATATDPSGSAFERAIAFYRDILDAEKVSLPGGRVVFRIVWTGPIATALEHLRLHEISVVEGPVGRLGARGPGQSVYFRDPDGSLIELISYE
jgi:hypothetical protein